MLAFWNWQVDLDMARLVECKFLRENLGSTSALKVSKPDSLGLVLAFLSSKEP